ncbi:MAG: Gfo/Idh/MocA family oxidoreductase [Planctomycetaceae bacterium]|jgi:predicted dehydrogenase|nr:Gfo/Idh/MocA family oxidoreductase [Planctomycetaceae bacterium]
MITRRHFLTAASVVSVPLFIPATAWSASGKLGVCIVGAGSRGDNHAHYFGKDSRTKVLYITDPYFKRAEMVCNTVEKKYGYRPKPLSDFRPALEDKSVDIVACAAANHWHALTAVWAMQHGKHCYIEKPLTHNLHECNVLVDLAKKTGIVFATGTQCRSTTNINELVAFIRSGAIGDVNFARVLVYKRRKTIGSLGNYPIPETCDYDFWTGPAPLKPLSRKKLLYDWHWQRLFGNGDMGNQGSHQYDVARWILNVNRFPKSVITYGGRFGYDIETKNPDYVDAGDTPNTSTAIYDYGDKCLVSEVRGLETSYGTIPVGTKQGTMVGVIAYGTEGYAIQGFHKPGQTFAMSYAFDKKGQLIKEFKSADNTGRMLTQFELTERHITNYLDAVAANDPSKVVADARCGALSVALAHLGNISYYLGENNKVSVNELKQTVQKIKSIDDNEATLASTLKHLTDNGVNLKRTPLSLGVVLNIDVEKEVFVDNDAANAMMTREYRKGFEV